MPKRVKKAATKRKRPSSDPNTRAHQMMAEMEAKQASGPEVEPEPPTPAQISAYMSKLGRKGGKKSGAKRMENLTPEKRSEIARMAALERWKKARKS